MGLSQLQRKHSKHGVLGLLRQQIIYKGIPFLHSGWSWRNCIKRSDMATAHHKSNHFIITQLMLVHHFGSHARDTQKGLDLSESSPAPSSLQYPTAG